MRRTGNMRKNVPGSAHVQCWAMGQPIRSSTQRGAPTLVTYLLLLVPLSLALAFGGAPSLWVFAVATAAIVPLAEWLRRATEQLTAHAGSAIGGLLNVTLGNVTELILALFVLMAGNSSVVKATITGSMIGNSLLGLGLAILVGSWGRHIQTFKRASRLAREPADPLGDRAAPPRPLQLHRALCHCYPKRASAR